MSQTLSPEQQELLTLLRNDHELDRKLWFHFATGEDICSWLMTTRFFEGDENDNLAHYVRAMDFELVEEAFKRDFGE